MELFVYVTSGGKNQLPTCSTFSRRMENLCLLSIPRRGIYWKTS